MPDICSGLGPDLSTMKTVRINRRVTSRIEIDGAIIDGSMDEGCLDYEPPMETIDEFRKKFMDSLKSARLSAG